MNEDLTMQLYGQISMFDQLTDYNDNDEVNSQQTPMGHKKLLVKRIKKLAARSTQFFDELDDDVIGGHGEDSAGCCCIGEDEETLHQYRQRIDENDDSDSNYDDL